MSSQMSKSHTTNTKIHLTFVGAHTQKIAKNRSGPQAISNVCMIHISLFSVYSIFFVNPSLFYWRILEEKKNSNFVENNLTQILFFTFKVFTLFEWFIRKYNKKNIV